MASSEAALYKMFSCQGGLNWIYGECTVKNVLLSRWFDLVRHGYGTLTFSLISDPVDFHAGILALFESAFFTTFPSF